MMHLPLLLVQDSVLKTKTPWPKLTWLGEDGGRVCSISQHLVGEVDLSSGSCSKVAKLTPFTKTTAAISATSDGVFVYGILSSGDLFFWHTVTNQVRQAKGIPEVVTHTTFPSDSNVMRDFLKQLLPQNFGSNVASDAVEQTTCPVPAHHRPKIFASPSCSKVVVVLRASQIYVWERSSGSRVEESQLSQHVPGSWSVVHCPGDVSLPSTHSKETQISCCFMCKENSEECLITFTFLECLSVVTSTLTLRWRGSRFHPPAAHWNSKLVSFSALGVQENELQQVKGILISSYAHGQSILAVAVNSWKQYSKLLYIHPLCNTAVATSIQDVVPHCRSSNKCNARSQWVSDLAWSHDALYLFGCLTSGALFVATRMGPLIKISCQGEGIHLQAANILGMQPNSIVFTEEMGEEEGNKSPGGLPSITFTISPHPNKHQILLSSGLRVSVLSLPLDGRKEGEVVDCLLASATHALHLLCNSAVTHDYAYIRDSTWRLAHSVLDLTQGLDSTSSSNPPNISLWDRRVVVAADNAGSQERTPGDDGELMQIEQVMKPLMAAWALIGSRSEAHTLEWKRRANEVVMVMTKLMATLLRITTHDDHLEHQLQVLLVLHFYHQFVRVLCLWPDSFYMLRPTLQLTHRLLHSVLACERHAGERSMVSTLLILSQTLSTLEHSLTQAFKLRPALLLQAPSKARKVLVDGDVEASDLILSSADDGMDQHEINSTVSLRMKNIWQCLYGNAKKVYSQLAGKKFDQESYQKSLLVLNILQDKLQSIGCDFDQRIMKLGRCHQLYLDGLYLKAIQSWKLEIIACLIKGHGKKVVCQDLHSILYASFVHEGSLGISRFINWLDDLLRSLLCPKKHSSLLNSPQMSATKDKSGEMELSFEYSKVNQIPKMEGTNEAAAKEDSEEIKVSLMRKLLCKEVNCDNRVHTFSPVEETSSQKHIEISRVPWIISAARQVMGSLGRLLALETLGYCPDVPPPHRPHVIPSLWTFTTQPQGKVHQLPTKRGAAVTGEWPVDAAAQALALAGCWADLAIFASWLDDAKMALVAGVLTTFGDNKVPVPSTVLPFYQIKALLCQPINSTVAEFHNHQELLQLAAMANLEVLPVILEECLAKMKELIPLFETFVPSQIHLPAPPMFCPLGPQDGEELLFHGAPDNSQSERRLRQEVGGWVRLTCQVTSAAGIAYPLLLSLQQKYSKLPLMGSEDLSNLVEALGCHQECWQPQGPEWERITWLWHQVVTLVWVLYSRDRLSLGIRSLVRNASAVQQNQDLEMCILEILSWVHELNTLCEHDSWRTELVACAVTAASEAPPVPAVAAALARVMPQPSLMPSLMKDKAERLFVTWKSTSIAFSEVEPHFKRKENETEDISSPDVFTSLFSFYQDRCEEIVKHLPSEEEKMETLSYINKCPTKFSNGISVAARIQEEFEKFLFLFVELTFMRDVQKFPQYISSVPLLVQFSDVLRRREFEGIKLKNKLHHDDTGSITSSVKHNILNSPSLNTMNPRSSVSTSEKKGLFRSIDYSKMLPRGSETIFVSSGKRHVTTTPTNTQSVNMVLHNIGKENLIKPKMSSPSRRKLPNLYLPGRRSRSLSRQKKRPVPVPRPRSLSVSGGRRTQQQRSSRQYSEPLHWNTSQKSNSSIKDLLLQRLLHLPRCLGYNTKQVEVDETIKLLHWMMRRERQFDFSVVESDSYIVRRLARNVKFTLDDVMLSVMWNDLPRYLSHMKNEKSYPEIENKKLKKKKKKEKGRQRTESVHVVPYNKHVASDDHSTVNQGEMLQAISSAGCPTRQQNTTPINTPSKGMECISEESNGVEIRDEQLCAELNAEGISNSYLTQMDQDKEIDDKENVQNDSESENCLSSPHDLPYEKLKSSLVDLSGSVDVQNHNIDSIINSSKDGERQDMKRSSKENSDTTATPCEDQDPHQHNHSPASQVTSLSKTKKRRKTSETLPVSFQAVELEQEDTDPDIRTTDQNNSRSENLSSDVSPSFKINPKNWSRGHQVEVHVHAKEAKQSVPCRLPILSAPHRANMTGVEAPEESFDPGVIRFGHLLHLSPDTPSVSKMLVPADASVGKNTRPTKPDQGIPEDTLDDITLPDSLHASDLEEQNESSASSQNMHDNIIKKNRYRSVSEKSRDRGTGLYVPLRVKKSVTYNDPHHWDCRDLNLKPVTLQVKSAHKATLRDEVNTSISEKHMAHMKENSNAKKSLKLLTLPKLSPLKKCDDKQEKSLQLKLLPIDDGFKNTAKEKRKNQNVITNTWLHPVEKKAEHMKPLTIPRFFDSAHNDDRKGNDLNFINPHQVFAFYRQSALKRHTEKFKKLQVSKKYFVSSEQPHAEPLISIERKEKKIPGEVAENIDRGFLDQVKDYVDKYRKGGYENILRNDKEVNEKEITVYYKPTDDKRMIDKSTQDDPHLTKEDKPVESIQNPSDMRDAFGSNKTHSFALKDNVLEREKKCENRSVNTDPYEMRQKTMKASSVQTGGLDGDRASALSSKSAVQTQTAALQTVDASVLTDSAVFGKSESVQVGSLLPSPPPPPPLKTKQPSPPPQSAVLPPQPSPSYTAPTHNSRPPSETGSAHHFLHTFDTPSETVKEELKDMEMNRTALSLDVGKSDQYVVHGLFDIGEKRKAEEYPKITNSDYNEESSLQKQTADHILDGTTRNDVREHRLLSHTAQNLCNDKKLYKAAPVSSVTITTDVLVKNMTMDNLYEEFCSGRISLEDFYLMSSNIPEDERKKESLQKIDNKGNILTLEQQVLEAAQSISESQHLMEKVKCLIQEPEAAETDTHTSQNCKSDEKFLNHSHWYQNSMAVARISKDVAWQEALSVYKNHGKVDSLLRFLEAADFENVTSAMINEIIQCENSIQSSEARKASEQKVHDDILLGHKNIDNITLTNNKILPRIKVNKMSEHKGYCEMLLNSVDTDTTGSGLLLTQDRMNLLSSRTESQELHLSSPFIRSPDTSCFSSLGSLLGESTSSLDHEEKIQKRRKEIRVWIKKQRQKRQEQAKANLSVTFTKPRLIADVTPATSRDHSSMTDAAAINITHENSGLTGKQLQERRKDREVKRARQREINQKKREADIVKLLNDHKEEATMYQSHVKPKLVCESSPKLTKFRKLQELKSNFNRNSHLSKKLYGSREPKSVHGFVCHKKPELNRYFKNSKEEWRKSQQHNQISSPLSQHSSEEREQYCVETSIEDNTSLQMEFYYLKKCLDNKNKEKHRTGIGTKEKQEPSMDEVHFSTLLKEEGITGKYIPSHPKLVVSKEGEASSSESRDSSLRHSLPLNATFTVPLDRISEVASNLSETSSQDHQEGDGATVLVSAGEDTSTDSSWNVPEEIRNLLYSSQ